jgi:hypothetical protein
MAGYLLVETGITTPVAGLLGSLLRGMEKATGSRGWRMVKVMLAVESPCLIA